jgi:hypothetical protein
MVCDWFNANGEAVAWREPRRELRPRSCSETAGEADDRGGYWVGVDDLSAALPSGDEPMSLFNDKDWPRLDNEEAPLLCGALSRTGESGKGGDRSNRLPSTTDPDRFRNSCRSFELMLLSSLVCMEGLSNPFRTGDGSPEMAKSISENPTELPLRLCPPALLLPGLLGAFHVTLLGVEERDDIVKL